MPRDPIIRSRAAPSGSPGGISRAGRHRPAARRPPADGSGTACEVVPTPAEISSPRRSSDQGSRRRVGRGCFCCCFDDFVAAQIPCSRRPADVILASRSGAVRIWLLRSHADAKLHGHRFRVSLRSPGVAACLPSVGDNAPGASPRRSLHLQLQQQMRLLSPQGDRLDPEMRAAYGRCRFALPVPSLILEPAGPGRASALCSSAGSTERPRGPRRCRLRHLRTGGGRARWLNAAGALEVPESIAWTQARIARELGASCTFAVRRGVCEAPPRARTHCHAHMCMRGTSLLSHPRRKKQQRQFCAGRDVLARGAPRHCAMRRAASHAGRCDTTLSGGTDMCRSWPSASVPTLSRPNSAIRQSRRSRELDGLSAAT